MRCWMLNTLEMLRDSSLLVVLRCADVVVGRRGIGSVRKCCFAAVLFVVGFCFGSLTVNIVSVITLYLAKFREQTHERAAFSSVGLIGSAFHFE